MSDVARQMTGIPAEMHAHECILFIPDFPEDEWIDRVLEAGERLLELERCATAAAESAAESLADLRRMLAPIIDPQNETTWSMVAALSMAIEGKTGKIVDVPFVGDHLEAPSARATFGTIVSSLLGMLTEDREEQAAVEEAAAAMNGN